MLGWPVAGEVGGSTLRQHGSSSHCQLGFKQGARGNAPLAFLKAKWGIQLWAEHIKGVDNQVADAISRNRVDQVCALNLQIADKPEEVDAEILQVLVHERRAGKNPDWRRLWRSCSRMA